MLGTAFDPEFCRQEWRDVMQTIDSDYSPTISELRLKMTQKLLELGADVNVANTRGSTAVHLMFKGQLSNHKLAKNGDEVLTLLLNAGAELNHLNKFGESPLSLAAKYGS
ncbi:hypothetical protein QAD02_024128 [Eretmocerus hayati]|uniref:Uncharacterized protein n=1 Tax=Eretmocerus hayati TaxID=131215 RepID=A0ACC2PZF3_9HYME|nr:hypothetical protein QAD02_024128 [Eretmocerus hayati]